MATLRELAKGFFETIEAWKAAAGSTKVQSVICMKSHFKSAADAKSWVSSHNFHAAKMDETTESFRFRQFEPSTCTPGSFRTIELTAGVSAVICKPSNG